jgi:two-component system sensor histidine kinase/response regulator
VHVLIVDDNASNRLALLDLVTGWGCTASAADGAGQALVILNEAVQGGHRFDLLLLDETMPDLDGYDLARMVRADARTPIVLLTTSAHRSEAETPDQPGIMGYVTKPVRSEPLRSAMSQALLPPSGTADSTSSPTTRNNRTESAKGAPGLPADGPIVLVVEDNVVNQKVLGIMLNSIGYRVDVAVNGFDALEALDRNHYLAVLMDCQMPQMDGFQTTEMLRQREGTDRHTPVIAVTASAMAGDQARCLNAGMDDYLSKPIKPKALAETLSRAQNSIRTPDRVIPISQ